MMTARKPATLGAGLIAKKGQASPISTTATNTPAATHAPSLSQVAKPSKAVADTVAVTLRLDAERYERLKIYGVRNRKTNQDILMAALDAYLKANGG